MDIMNGNWRSILVSIVTAILLILNSNGILKIPAEAITMIASVFLGGDAIVRSAKSIAVGKLDSVPWIEGVAVGDSISPSSYELTTSVEAREKSIKARETTRAKMVQDSRDTINRI